MGMSSLMPGFGTARRAGQCGRPHSRASSEGGQTRTGHENAEPILLAPRIAAIDWRLCSRFLAGFRLRFGCRLLSGLGLLLRRKFLLDIRGDGVHVYLVAVRGIAENLCR